MATHYSTKGFFHNTPKARDGAVRIHFHRQAVLAGR